MIPLGAVCFAIAVVVAIVTMLHGSRPNTATWITIATIFSLFALIFLISFWFGDDFEGSPPSETGMRLLTWVNVIALILTLYGFIRSNKKLHLVIFIGIAAFFWYWCMFYVVMSINRNWI